MEQERKRADDIVKKLIDTHTTISTMESCTSGLIASMITDTEGASAIFPGGYVTYLNETKILNGVDANVIEKYGVYSRECANAMAEKTAHRHCHRYHRNDRECGSEQCGQCTGTGIFLYPDGEGESYI